MLTDQLSKENQIQPKSSSQSQRRSDSKQQQGVNCLSANLFQGETISILECTNCKYRKTNYELFEDLAVHPISNNFKQSLTTRYPKGEFDD